MGKKRIKPSDLYWGLGWMFSYLFYSKASVSWLFVHARIKGIFRSIISSKRRSIAENLKVVYGKEKSAKEIKIITRRHFEYLEKNDLTFLLPQLKNFQVSSNWPIEGLEYLDAALEKKCGAILLSAHFGYGRVISHLLRLHGYKVNLVGVKSDPTFSNRYKKDRQWRRQHRPLSMFCKYMHERFQLAKNAYDVCDLVAHMNVRPLLKALKNNEILIILGDGLHALNFVNVKILNQILPFPTGPMSIANATGTTVLPTFAVDTKNGLGIKIQIEQPLHIKPTNDSNNEIAEKIHQFAQIYQAYINRYPHLYRWSKDNWFEKRIKQSQKDVSERFVDQPAKI